jgi:hypothetical protein
MRFNRRSPCWVMAALILLVLPAYALALDVDVFAEGAYTATALEVRIYANINAGNLCSYGAKLSYDTSKLTVGTATKNDDVWYFGTTAAKQGYMNPDTATAGQIIFIGGKLDTGSPTAGVTGTRVLLGKATFTRKESSMGLGTTAETYFGINLALGKASPYDNFVTTAGVVKDGAGVAFNTANTVRERGDANGDGSVTPADMIAVRNAYYGGAALGNAVAADCNGDGSVTPADMICIRNKYYAP